MRPVVSWSGGWKGRTREEQKGVPRDSETALRLGCGDGCVTVSMCQNLQNCTLQKDDVS